MTDTAALRTEVIVDTDVDRAFAIFTEDIGMWWPLYQVSVHGVGTGDSRVAFVGGQLLETAKDGTAAPWGVIESWDPPHRVGFGWHPGHPESEPAHVTVTFEPSGDRTRVALVHDGWDVYPDPEAIRREYESGWPKVLSKYVEAVAAQR